MSLAAQASDAATPVTASAVNSDLLPTDRPLAVAVSTSRDERSSSSDKKFFDTPDPLTLRPAPSTGRTTNKRGHRVP
ncbi:hypothetical protein GCM10020369_24940 [Cryptosporangium minutisporangium]|uniref:Uncharacterized protein n=1 Tax=Cryptosporangium minutisporangium TaxID=113569 RepID=A0ABP6SVI9_9ACTN